jgi:LAO/AO transport system kinase
VGITGPPGAGNSTLLSDVLKSLAKSNLKIGVIAVDPTSPFSQGAILGDRIRYNEEALGHNVFVRSIGTRGSLGGLASVVYLLLRAFDACEFDLVFIETVGVGQVEVEVMNVADQVVLVLVPESGDSIQAMKAGVIEMADLIVLNKSDRPGAEALKRELEAQINLLEKSETKVIGASALNGQGMDDVVKALRDMRDSQKCNEPRTSPIRLRAEALALKRFEIEQQALRKIQRVHSGKDLQKLF